MTPLRNERGATAVLVAGALLFLFGAAALAVDTSIFYGDARTDQTTADLSCLAGVIENDSDDKITMAAEFARQNWPTMQGESVSIVGTTGSMSDGTNQVLFEAEFDGDEDRMRVRVLEVADTNFAAVLGASSVNVVQEAICLRGYEQTGSGPLPIGIIPGGFDGGIFQPNPCGTNSGNCGGLAIGGPGANTFAENISEGIPRNLSKHHGPATWPDSDTGLIVTDCDSVGEKGECNHLSTETGSMAGKLATGFLERFANDPDATCTFLRDGDLINCDSPAQIIGNGGPVGLYSQFGATPPAWWEVSLYGPWDAASTTNHYWHDGVVDKCDSPRRALVPIVDDDADWDIGDPGSGWPSGSSSDVKVVALVDVIIIDPNNNGDFTGNGNGQGAKTVTADVVWYGPNAVCSDGSPVGVLNGITGTYKPSVKLVAG
jgi:hypothetical protein